MTTVTATSSAPTKVITGRVRASYVHAFQPHTSIVGAEPKYSITLLIPKSDTKTLGSMRAAADEAIARKWPGKRPARIDTTLHDGDGTRPNGEPFGPECRGHMVITVSSKERPGIVDAALRPIIDPDGFQSGDYCRASVNAYGYDISGKRGVSFGLNNIQVLERGESLSGRARAEDEFSAANDTATADVPW